MVSGRTCLVWLPLWAVTAAAEPDVQSASDYRVVVPRLASAPTIDGQLEEGAWGGARRLVSFTQMEPHEGAPSDQQTEVLVGYDARALYVAFRCATSAALVATSMNRDAYLDVEDHVELALDTFQDRQSAFLFRTNPLGVRVDGTIRDNGEDVRWDWDDARWSVAAARDASGWTAEFSIPFSSLRFPDTASPTFGVNFARFIGASHELSFWKPMPYSRGVWSSRHKVANYGALTGFADLARANLFDAKPYVFLGGTQRGSGPLTALTQGGLDVKIPLTSSLIADLTVNPDFAEAEADEQQVNLTRFPLLFPEKREFFKEGASLFYFGDRVVDTSNETLEQLIFFQSRQIGLAKDGQTTTPVIGGARVTGKIGQLGLGLLNLTTAEVRDPATGVDTPLFNDSVLRLKYELSDSSSVGLMALNKQGGDKSFNRGLGLDANWVATDFLRFGGYLAKTFSPGRVGDDLAGSGDVVLQTKHLSLHALYTDIGRNFNPELGYLTRPGIRKVQAVPILTVSPGLLGIKHASLIYDFNFVMDRDWRLLSRLHKGELLVIFENGYAFAVIPTVDQLERLTEPFHIYGDVVIPEGVYVYRSLFFGFGTDLSARLAGIIWLDGGWFYGGTRFRSRLSLFARPINGLTVTAVYDRQAASLPQGSFVSHIVSAVATYAFTPSLTTRATLQFASDDRVRANLLLTWTYLPGANLSLIANYQRDLSPAGDRPWLDGITAGIKMTYTWGPPAPSLAAARPSAQPQVELDEGFSRCPPFACLEPAGGTWRLPSTSSLAGLELDPHTR